MKNKNIIPMHQIGFPIDLEIIIPEDDSVRLLYEITEGLNYSKLYEAYSTIGRNPAILPESLFRILIYGYMEGIYSSRKLEKACNRDINFKWLMQGQKAPTHNTIARFRSERLASCIKDLFSQLIIKLGELDEIEFKNIFIDGTKIEANANRYTFVWKKAIEKFETKLQEKIRMILENMNSELNLNIDISDNKILASDIDIILKNKLKIIKENENIKFVYGKGKRKSKLQKYTESLENFVEKQSKYDEYNSIFNGRNSFSKTDHDATFMHMKEDHMRNGQLKPGYNVQIGVEGEYIVGVDISSERSDQLTFIPFLEKLQTNLNKKYEAVTADAGYESDENYTYLEKNEQQSYIKPQTYERSKTKKFKNDISKRENMQYNKDDDYYVCAAGKKLLLKGIRIRKSKSGFESKITIYECESCLECKYKSKCTKAKGNKQLHVAKDFLRLREKSLLNITTPKGIILRMNRSIQVEGAFGVVKEDYGFRRFLMRGNKNVKIEFLLMSFGYNVNKLHSKTINNRNGELLHKQQAS
ncbi:MAG: IS1182 family transposase [Clostridium sp.]|uniref:IS1182 family transposase n=1 Tax=Clostridium sp. TaxID=1506 RepID=UPI0025BEB22C|nr:IS1182 family transposase [Clostridium sp.]MCE5221961.1 IS1182 family transposase [Clostridium sp.]